MWPPQQGWPHPNENRGEGACLEHLSAKQARDVEDSAPPEETRDSWACRPFFRFPLALQLGPGLQPSETPHQTGFVFFLAPEPFSQTSTRPCSVTRTHTPLLLCPAASNLGSSISRSFHSSWSWAEVWDLSSEKHHKVCIPV